MRNSLLLLLSLFFSASVLNAQFKFVGESPAFEEPEEGLASVRQLKNGNTLFIHFNTKRHFKITYDFYNNQHKKINSGNFTPEDPDLAVSIEDILEIGEDVAIFLTTNIKRIPTLQRLIIDTKTGTLKGLTTLADITPEPANMYEDIRPTRILKYPNSDKYVVISTEKDKVEKKKKLQIVVFDNNHKIIKSLSSIDPIVNLMHLYAGYAEFISEGKIAIACYLIRSKSDNQNIEKKLVIFDLEKNGQDLVDLPSITTFSVLDEIVKINMATKQILQFTSVGDQKKQQIEANYLTSIDLETKKILYSKNLPPSAAAQKNSELFGKEKDEVMAFQNLTVNNDGSISVFYESTAINTSYHPDTKTTSTVSFLRNLIVVQYDKNGNELASMIIPKFQKSINVSYPIFHSGGISTPITALHHGVQYKSFTCFSGPKNRYVLFNDSPDNVEKENLKATTSSKKGDAYYIDLSENKLVGTRNSVFPENSANKTNITPGLFSVLNYDEKNNILVTLKMIPEGKNNGMQLIWLQPQ